MGNYGQDFYAEPNDRSNKERSDEKKTQATMLVDLATAAGVHLWHDLDEEPYATVPVDQHLENYPLKVKGFRRWLKRLFYDEFAKAPGSQGVQDALGTLEGKAVYEGDRHEVFTRFAGDGDRIYLDLADDGWRCVEVLASGWRILEDSPIKFRRPKGLMPLPPPIRGGKIDELRKFVNVGDDESFRLIVAWLVGTLCPNGPYAGIELDGEQGCAKSTTARVLRRLIDPNKADLRSQPKDERDLCIAGHNSHIVAFDNLSDIPTWLSDGLCRVATGAGFATRTLHSDADETLFSGARPIILNGIGGAVERPDLADRVIKITLPRIAETQRRDEQSFWREFEEALPAILGALLDVVAGALRRMGSVKLVNSPRMADFAKWVVAAEHSLGWEDGSFLKAYKENIASGHQLAIEGSPVADAIRNWIGRKREWSGSFQTLLTELVERLPDRIVKDRQWPKTARKLGGALRRAAPNLRAVGIDVDFDVPIGRGDDKRVGVRFGIRGGEKHPTHPTHPNPASEPQNGDFRGALGVGRIHPNEPDAPHKNGVLDPKTAVGVDGVHGADVFPKRQGPYLRRRPQGSLPKPCRLSV